MLLPSSISSLQVSAEVQLFEKLFEVYCCVVEKISLLYSTVDYFADFRHWAFLWESLRKQDSVIVQLQMFKGMLSTY